MSDEKNKNAPVETDTPQKKRGRKPMTDAEKEAAAKLREAEKERAQNLRPDIFLQYQDCDMDMAELVEAAKINFHKEKKRTPVTEMKLYVKPEDRTAYYVINGTYEGKVSF